MLHEKMLFELKMREEMGFDLIPCLFGASLVLVPFFMGYFAKDFINANSFNNSMHVSADKTYMISALAATSNDNSSIPKNPPTADPLPDHDLDINTIKPNPIDQHGTCGVPGFI